MVAGTTAIMRRAAPCRAAVHAGVPEADGIGFASRFTGDNCVAAFDRAFGRLRVVSIAELVRHVEFLDVLDDYGIVLAEPPGVEEMTGGKIGQLEGRVNGARQ